MNLKILKIILNTMAWVGLAITLWIVYKQINNTFSVCFVVAYMVFLTIYVICTSITKVIQMRYLNRQQVRKIVGRFLKNFFITFLVLLIGDALTKASNLDMVQVLCIAFGVSIGSLAIRKDMSNR